MVVAAVGGVWWAILSPGGRCSARKKGMVRGRGAGRGGEGMLLSLVLVGRGG